MKPLLATAGANAERLHITFCAVPMLGHLMPMIPYAQELQRRGHQVSVCHNEAPKYRQILEENGLGDCQSVPYHCYNEHKWGETLYEAVMKHLSSTNPAAELPHVLVYDFFAVEAADAADVRNIPSIGVFPNPRSINPWAATLEEQSSFKWKLWCYFMWSLEGVLARMLWIMRSRQRWKRGLPLLMEQDVYPSPYMPRPMLGSTCPELEFPDLPVAPLFRMVGPSVPERTTNLVNSDLQQWIDVQGTRPIIYIAFGSQQNHTEASVQKLEEELHSLGSHVAVVWSLPMQQQDWLKKAIPSNWYVSKFLPQVALLQSGYIRAFVSHCGSNSVYESLLSGVPIICCPGAADQPANATRLVRAGVALLAKHSLHQAIEQVLKDAEMSLRSRELAATLNSHHGAKAAADWIEAVARKGTGVIGERPSRRRFPMLRTLLLAVMTVAAAVIAL